MHHTDTPPRRNMVDARRKEAKVYRRIFEPSRTNGRSTSSPQKSNLQLLFGHVRGPAPLRRNRALLKEGYCPRQAATPEISNFCFRMQNDKIHAALE